MGMIEKDLSALAFFSDLSQETQYQFKEDSYIQKYSDSEIIQMEGEPCQWVAFILSGKVQVYRLSVNGREQILGNLQTGMQFNSVPAIDSNSKHRASIRSLGNSSLLQVPVTKFRQLLQTRADLAYVILQDFSKRLDHLTVLVERLSLHSIRGRLASFLLEQADQGIETGYWTLDEIAAHLGTVRDVVGRTLRNFSDAGLVRRDSGHLILLDRKKLEDETQF